VPLHTILVTIVPAGKVTVNGTVAPGHTFTGIAVNDGGGKGAGATVMGPIVTGHGTQMFPTTPDDVAITVYVPAVVCGPKLIAAPVPGIGAPTAIPSRTN
jgi:hypothetical protein